MGGQTRSWQGCAEVGESRRVFLALLDQERVSRGGDIGAGFWRGRRCQVKEKSLWEGVSAQAKKGRHVGLLLCVGAQEGGQAGPCGGVAVRLEEDEEVGKASLGSWDFVLGWGGSGEPWKGLEQGKTRSELELELEKRDWMPVAGR